MPYTGLMVDVVAALACLGFVWHAWRHRSRSLLERRTVVVLLVLGAFFALRPVAAQWPTRWLAFPAFTAAALAPLACGLFVEGLLRRHLPLWLKLLTGGTAVLLPLAWLVRPAEAARLELLLGAVFVVVLLSLAGLLTRYDRERLARSEDDLAVGVRYVALAAAVMVPANAALDGLNGVVGLGGLGGGAGVGVGAGGGAGEAAAPLGLDALAATAFVYVVMRITESRNSPARVSVDFAWRLVQAALLAVVLVVVAGGAGDGYAWAAAATLALAVVLCFEVWERVGNRVTFGDDRALLRWLASASTGSFDEFLAALGRYSRTAQHLVIGPSDLAGYDGDRIAAAFPAAAPVRSTAELRRLADEGGGADPRERDGAEQVLDLLGTYEMTHACLIESSPPRLLLFHVPEVAGSYDAMLELRIIQRLGQIALATERARA